MAPAQQQARGRHVGVGAAWAASQRGAHGAAWRQRNASTSVPPGLPRAPPSPAAASAALVSATCVGRLCGTAPPRAAATTQCWRWRCAAGGAGCCRQPTAARGCLRGDGKQGGGRLPLRCGRPCVQRTSSISLPTHCQPDAPRQAAARKHTKRTASIAASRWRCHDLRRHLAAQAAAPARADVTRQTSAADAPPAAGGFDTRSIALKANTKALVVSRIKSMLARRQCSSLHQGRLFRGKAGVGRRGLQRQAHSPGRLLLAAAARASNGSEQRRARALRCGGWRGGGVSSGTGLVPCAVGGLQPSWAAPRRCAAAAAAPSGLARPPASLQSTRDNSAV